MQIEDRRLMLRPRIDRRDFLRTTLSVSALYFAGCNGQEPRKLSATGFDGSGQLPGTNLPEPFDGGQFLETLPFLGEERAPIGSRRRKGHDCRLAIDLASLVEPKTNLTPNDQFYIRTEYPDLLDPHVPWKVKILGHVAEEKEIPLEELLPLAEPQGAVLLECAGNTDGLGFGLLSVADWGGIPISRFVELAAPSPEAKRVLISGFDDRTTSSTHSAPGASWIFTLDELTNAGAFLATEMNGVDLPSDHGAPLRLIVPNWYGCCEIKWLNEVRFVGDDEPATLQMKEFASRTHQEGMPMMAGDFAPATLDVTAIPVRVEKWKLDGKLAYRTIGITWGGDQPADAISIRFGKDEQWQPLTAYVPRLPDLPFGVWCHRWEPTLTGGYTIELKVPDESIRTRRLDSRFYARRVRVTEV